MHRPRFAWTATLLNRLPAAQLTSYRLLMGGRLGRHNIGGRVTFTLTPGYLRDKDMVSNIEMKYLLDRAMFIRHFELEKAKHF